MLQIRTMRPDDWGSYGRHTQDQGGGWNSPSISALTADHACVDALSLIVEADGTVVAGIRHWRVLMGEYVPALLMERTFVKPTHIDEGLEAWLIRESLDRAYRLGHRVVVTLGHPERFRRFGFSRSLGAAFSLPGYECQDEETLLVMEFCPGTLMGVNGPINRWSENEDDAITSGMNNGPWTYQGATATAE